MVSSLNFQLPHICTLKYFELSKYTDNFKDFSKISKHGPQKYVKIFPTDFIARQQKFLLTTIISGWFFLASRITFIELYLDSLLIFSPYSRPISFFYFLTTLKEHFRNSLKIKVSWGHLFFNLHFLFMVFKKTGSDKIIY